MLAPSIGHYQFVGGNIVSSFKALCRQINHIFKINTALSGECSIPCVKQGLDDI